MIKDEKQYKLTQQLVGEFEKSLAAIEKDENRIKTDPDGWEIIRGSFKYQVDKLTAEIAEYERLISHNYSQPISLIIDNFNDLPQILIKARIAAKLSQKELADLAGMTGEQIQRYEDNDYEDASFLEIKFVLDALDIKIQKGELIVPLDTLRRTPVTKEELLFSRSRTHSQLERQTSKQVQ